MTRLLALAMLATAGVAQGQRWDFQVFLDNTPIGYHHFALRDVGEGQRELKSEARFDVKFLFINAYRYVHDATERWRGNCLSELIASTNDNGTNTPVLASPREGRFNVETGGKRQSVEGCVMTFAYWNPDILTQKRLLNPQTGRLEAVTITPLGEDNVVMRGATVPAWRYRISGPKHPIDLWYGAERNWLALQSTVDGGRRLRYQLK
jgi:hypothetical protein